MNEVMNNEVFDDVAVAENGSVDSTKKFLVGAGIGFGVAVLGGLIINKLVKPAISKYRAKKNRQVANSYEADQDTFDENKYGE